MSWVFKSNQNKSTQKLTAGFNTNYSTRTCQLNILLLFLFY